MDRFKSYLINQTKVCSNLEIPEHLLCRITDDLMIDPVCLSSGFSYEREAIKKHFKTNGFFDPVNREAVNPDILIENKNLKSAIELFLKDNPWAYKHIPGQTEDTM